MGIRGKSVLRKLTSTLTDWRALCDGRDGLGSSRGCMRAAIAVKERGSFIMLDAGDWAPKRERQCK